MQGGVGRFHLLVGQVERLRQVVKHALAAGVEKEVVECLREVRCVVFVYETLCLQSGTGLSFKEVILVLSSILMGADAGPLAVLFKRTTRRGSKHRHKSW